MEVEWKWKSGEKWGRPGNTYHMNDVRWTQGGHRGAVPDYKTCVINLRVSFLPVKWSTHDLVNV